MLLYQGDLSTRPRCAPPRTSYLCSWLGSLGRPRGRGGFPSPPSWPFNVTGLLPPMFLVHSQLLIAPGPAGMGPVTWLFSQPSSVTRGCFVFATAIKSNCAVRHLILAFRHPCSISFPGLLPFAIPSNVPSGNPITTLKDKRPGYSEVSVHLSE